MTNNPSEIMKRMPNWVLIAKQEGTRICFRRHNFAIDERALCPLKRAPIKTYKKTRFVRKVRKVPTGRLLEAGLLSLNSARLP